jgi:hypothetical protein
VKTDKTATLASVDDSKLLPNYHLYSDTPENVGPVGTGVPMTSRETEGRDGKGHPVRDFPAPFRFGALFPGT